ncbi:hypothetical protein K7X08_029999 [Anisodus acutangulus]|uniref:Uncharacterized protein n=1 Tax=Anisodus acutangulus TaxID=402998 RepID=A0A9Q1R355_9SOLA|nr:hypothetical protein K7X08_029999 [Anisodus acutangulus]
MYNCSYTSKGTLKIIQRKDLHFMANRALGEETPFEVARELLIAISNLLPDIVRVENSCSSNDTVAASRDGTEDFRSQLMSISHSQSSELSL